VRQAGLRCALSAKAHEGRLIVMDTLAVPEAKTVCTDGDAATDTSRTTFPEQCSVMLLDFSACDYHMQKSAVHMFPQRFMDTALEALLADAPRRSVLMVDTAKDGADGGCAEQPACAASVKSHVCHILHRL
jgi:hypothetical protein